jgi:DNA-binding NarL/FixJ family response regulator
MQRRILLADDHEIVRRGLRSILGTRPDWEICGEAADGREAVDEAKRLLPDLVIMDIGMPGLNGLGATRQIIRELPGTEVLILTMHQSEQIVWEVLDAGARGFVLKSDAGSDLVAAAEALLEHKLSLTGKISELLLRAYLSKAPRPEERELTVREQETLELLAEGKSNKGIAEAPHISVKTAEVHRSRLMKKLNFRNMGELMRYAVRKGIIVP